MPKKPRKLKPKPELEVLLKNIDAGDDLPPEDEAKLQYGERVRYEARKVGRPAYVPTEWVRNVIESMVFTGFDQERIAKHFDLSLPTLRKYYAQELDHGADGYIARVGASLGMKALAGDTTACIFILKTRAGWTEKTKIEVEDGGMTATDKRQLLGRVMDMIEEQRLVAERAAQTIDITPKPEDKP